jgi:hypothetical protein
MLFYRKFNFNISRMSMVEGEVTSRQDGDAFTWVKPKVDATAAGGGMTRSAVRGSYLRLRSSNRAGWRPHVGR